MGDFGEKTDCINEKMLSYIAGQEMAEAALLVRKSGKLVYQNTWGGASCDSMYRMMSLTKIVTSIAILKLMEQGKVTLEDSIAKYLPAFSDMKVACDERYIGVEASQEKLLSCLPSFVLEEVKTVPAKRPITIRDLLSHSAGLEQGDVGFLTLYSMKEGDKTLKERVERYSHYVLGFQPGNGTGYSPICGFAVLGKLIEIISGMRYEEFLQKEICEPLEMKNTTFFLSEEQKAKLVPVYERADGKLVDVTGTKKDMNGFLLQNPIRFEDGSAGLFSTVADFEHVADMLCHHGRYRDSQFLKPETVELMHTPAAEKYMEPEPGLVWGLGVQIRENPGKAGSFATQGTYGWSGMFGTHLFVSPKDELEAVFVTNRCDLDGSHSYISREVERMVFQMYSESE